MELGIIGAGLAIGLGGIGAAVGESMIASSTMNAILRNPDLKNKLLIYMILFIALDETVAIYGLIIALGEPSLSSALAVGLPGLFVGIGEGYLAKTSIENIGKNGELQSTYMVFTILGMALIESAAIYGLIIAL